MQSDIINKHAMQYGKHRRRSKKNALASSAMIWSKAETKQKQAKTNETEKKNEATTELQRVHSFDHQYLVEPV